MEERVRIEVFDQACKGERIIPHGEEGLMEDCEELVEAGDGKEAEDEHHGKADEHAAPRWFPPADKQKAEGEEDERDGEA